MLVSSKDNLYLTTTLFLLHNFLFFPHKTPVTYSIGFYTAGLSFIIFDGEFLFISPWIYAISFAATVSFVALILFLLLLSLMLIHELCNEVITC